jgi:hypothetical protein
MSFNVDVVIRQGMTAPDVPFGSIRLAKSDISTHSQHFGSNHILEMGRHFDEYVVAWLPTQIFSFAGIATVHRFPTIAGKQRATSVLGNIGEVVAGITIRRKLRVGPTRICHLFPKSRQKTPDFLLDCRIHTPQVLAQQMPAGLGVPVSLLPLEAKAGKTNGSINSSEEKALKQLASFWVHRHPFDNQVSGFGLIVSFNYGTDRLIRISLITPINPNAFRAAVADHRTNANTMQVFINAFSNPNSALRGMIHNG